MQPELQGLPPQCRGNKSWTKNIVANSAYHGINENPVAYTAPTSMLTSLDELPNEVPFGVGYDTDAERALRKWLRAEIQKNVVAPQRFHPTIRGDILALSIAARDSLDALQAVYDQWTSGGNPLRNKPYSPTAGWTQARAEILVAMERSLDLFWCAMYLRALSESWALNKAQYLTGQMFKVEGLNTGGIEAQSVKQAAFVPAPEDDGEGIDLDGGALVDEDVGETETDTDTAGTGGGIVAVAIAGGLLALTLTLKK